MTQPAYRDAMIVVHPAVPEWGPGKIVKTEGDRLHIVWRDVPGREAKVIDVSRVSLRPAPDQHDPILDNLPPLAEKDGKLLLPKERITLEQARGVFLGKFPMAFKDPVYLDDMDAGERRYKWVAHEYWVDRFGGGRFREMLQSDLAGLVGEVFRCISKVNLLYPTEAAALRDALRVEPAARQFLATLADLLEADAPCEEMFTPYAKAVTDLPAERGRVATWPVATILPFLAQPDRHMFLKPEVTQKAADALGFNLNYRAEPNWLTYSRLLEMARIYTELLADWEPRDLIDVQSFFWVSCS